MKTETAQKAAKWWADYLRTPKMPDNGDQSRTGGMTMALASLLQDAETRKAGPDDADKFEKALAQILSKKSGDYLYVGVDYHPDYILEEAAGVAGINLGMTRLPWKTSMWINGDTVRVAPGYQASPVEI